MKFFKYLFSILFSIILTTLVIGFIGFFSVKSIFNRGSMKSLLKSFNFSDFIVDQDGNYTSLGKDIKKELKDAGVPEELVEEFLNAEPVVDFFADYIGDTVDYILYDDDSNRMSSSDIANFINDNVDAIFNDLREKKVEGYELLTDEALNEIKSNVNEVSIELEKSLPDIKKDFELEEGEEALKIFRFVLSNTVVVIFISIIVFFSLLILLLNLKKCRFGYWLGIIYMIPAIIFGIVYIQFKLIISDFEFVKAFDSICGFILRRIVFVSLIFFVIGLLLLILAIIVGTKKKSKKSNNNQEFIATPVEPVQPIEPAVSQPIIEQPVEPITPEPVVEEQQPVFEEVKTDVNVPVLPEAKQSFCSSCGAVMEAGQKFCYNCGNAKE